MRSLGRVILLLVISLVAMRAFSAPSPFFNIPNASDPGRVGQRVQTPVPLGKPGGAVEQEMPAQQAALTEAAKIKFHLNRIILKGNTVFSEHELLPLYQSYLHKKISLQDLQQITDLITKKYRESGYILSRTIIPPQAIKNGIVHLQIIEGYISKVEIKGYAGNKKIIVMKFAKHILESRPLNIKVLERYVLLANDVPGLDVKAVITPSANVPGSADLTLIPESQKASLSYIFNNYGTRFIGPNQITASVTGFSMLMSGDSNTVRAVQTSHNTELQFLEGVHTNYIGTSGLSLTIDGNYTKTHPLFTLQPLNIVGMAFQFYTDLIYPVLRQRSTNFFVHGMVNYQNVNSTLAGFPFYQDRFRNVTLGGSFQNVDSYYGVNSFSLDYSHGFPFFGAHTHALQSRPNGQTIFNKINLTLSRLQGLTERFSFLGSMQAQYSPDPLLATMQYGFGGPLYGRGYDPSEIIGDKALASKFELRFDTTPGFRFLNTIQYYLFYDAGVVWNNDSINLAAKLSATSAGFGLRFGFTSVMTGEFYIGKPLTLNQAVLVALGEKPHMARTFFQIAITI